MSSAVTSLEDAQRRAMLGRPKTGGFPYLAETLRRAGVERSIWHLPACQSLYVTHKGPVILQGVPLISGAFDVPTFNREALLTALRTDQAGTSTFPQLLTSAWNAGVIRYEVDFLQRTVTYFGWTGESYKEAYPEVELP